MPAGPEGAERGGEAGGRLVRIEDPDDPRVAAFRDIRERDLRGREGLIVAEGTVVLSVLARVHGRPGRARARSLLVLENRLESVTGLIARFPEDVPVMVAGRTVMDAIAGFPIHRGVLAIASPPDPTGWREMVAGLPDDALVLAASAIANHDNMGALFRNAAAFGADAVILDERCCDPLYRKAIRVSVGHALAVPFAAGAPTGDLLEVLRGHGIHVFGLSPDGTRTLADLPPARRAALLVGAEGPGLDPGVKGAVTTLRIAQAPGVDSLNVATAAGIALHAMATRMGRLA